MIGKIEMDWKAITDKSRHLGNFGQHLPFELEYLETLRPCTT